MVLLDFGIQIVSLLVDYKEVVFVKYACGGRSRSVCSESGIIQLRNYSARPPMLHIFQ